VARAIVRGEDGLSRCWWGASTPSYRAYHDQEWGRPTRDDRWIYEKLCLEGFQSGLSWLTILNKRENFRAAFANFDFDAVARFNRRSVDRLLADAGIVRQRGKIESTINNAKRAREIRDEFGSLAAFVWQFEPPAKSRPTTMTRAALMKLAKTPESAALSKVLKTRGWSFVGPTTVYAFMQAAGLVNDHMEGCAARSQCRSARREFDVPRPRPT
jgi:DNA-3-methyladenine glycosylase I